MIYRGYHVVLRDGRYSVYGSYNQTDGYTDRTGTFNERGAAERWIRELRKADKTVRTP